MAQKGQLLGIAVRPVRHGPMNQVDTVWITTKSGVGNDARGAPGRRQVTIISQQGWTAACSELGLDQLSWTTRRANLLVAGIELQGKIGYDLRIGNAVLTISGETKPCQVMEQAQSGLMTALKPEWRGGVTCRVTRSGEASVGCEVVLSRSPIRQLARVTSHHSRRLLKRSRSIAADLAHQFGLKKGKREQQTDH